MTQVPASCYSPGRLDERCGIAGCVLRQESIRNPREGDERAEGFRTESSTAILDQRLRLRERKMVPRRLLSHIQFKLDMGVIFRHFDPESFSSKVWKLSCQVYASKKA